jgi:hypothetical protein
MFFASLVLLPCCRCGSESSTLRQLNAHPVRQLAFWGSFAAAPLEDRVIDAPPEVIDYLHKDNAFQGWPQRPRPARLAADQRRDLREALREIPAPVAKRLRSKLAAVIMVEELGGSAYAERVRDGDVPEVAGFVVLDAAVLDRPANTWATWKDMSPFAPDGVHRLESTIETPETDNRKNALQYILLHEIGHVIAFGRDVHPSWFEPRPGRNTSKYRFFNLTWRIRDDGYGSIFDDANPMLREVKYYASGDRRLPAARIESVYDALEQTSFASLYGATNHQDDFAEAFVTYVHTVLQQRPFHVRIFAGDEWRKTYNACWGEERCAAKQRYLEELLSP